MAKIVLDISEKNIDTVKNILDNLKVGLIDNIEVQQRKYMAKNKPLEDDFIPKNKSSKGKYLSPNEFKTRIKR